MSIVRGFGVFCILAGATLFTGCVQTGPSPSDKQPTDLVLLHAGSLAVPLRQVTELFRREHPEIRVLAEAAGSVDTARKVSDLGRPCDVMAVADYGVLDRLMIPAHAEFAILFASNEMAIACTKESRHAARINADNWHEILQLPDVTFGRADPHRDPCGYRTVMLFQLAEQHYRLPGLADKLLAKDRRFIRPKETDLLALLEAGEIDYLFIYASVIQQHQLKKVSLPDRVNLKTPELGDWYRQATVEIAGKTPGETMTQIGEAIVYGVTIPRNAPQAEAARAYVELLLSPRGQEVFQRCGQLPLSPAVAHGFDRLPENLKPLCRTPGALP